MPDDPAHPRPDRPARPDLSAKADPRRALRRQIDENLRAAFGAVLDEPCPDHIARLLYKLSAGPDATGGSDPGGSGVAPP